MNYLRGFFCSVAVRCNNFHCCIHIVDGPALATVLLIVFYTLYNINDFSVLFISVIWHQHPRSLILFEITLCDTSFNTTVIITSSFQCAGDLIGLVLKCILYTMYWLNTASIDVHILYSRRSIFTSWKHLIDMLYFFIC